MMNYEPVKVYLPHSSHTDKDDLFVCPYDSVHRVAGKRFVRHILKCKKNYPHVDMDICPFNSRHMMPKKEMEKHIPCCPDFHAVEMDMAQPPVKPLPEHNFCDEEDWGNDVNKDYSVMDIPKIPPSPHAKPGMYICLRREEIVRKKELLKKQRFERCGLRRPELNPEEKLFQRKMDIIKEDEVPEAPRRSTLSRGRSLNRFSEDTVGHPKMAARFGKGRGQAVMDYYKNPAMCN